MYQILGMYGAGVVAAWVMNFLAEFIDNPRAGVTVRDVLYKSYLSWVCVVIVLFFFLNDLRRFLSDRFDWILDIEIVRRRSKSLVLPESYRIQPNTDPRV